MPNAAARVGRERRSLAGGPVVLLLVGLVLLPAGLVLPRALAGQGGSLVTPEGRVDWNRYYTAGETEQILREFATLFPGLTELTAIGRSYEGRRLWVMEVTDERTGPAGRKPALYLDGGIHAGELTGSQVALYVLGQLLLGASEGDPEISELLRRYAFYIRPKFNPDGSDLALIEDQSLRSTVRPWDEDGDGRADEDPPEDLDGDGWITSMRIPDPEGEWMAHPEDDRVMIRVSAGAPAAATGRRYRLLREGVDNDGDGRLNEDGVGGLDMNRNFPRNWEREHLQPGAGPFPLSEPETHATVRFISSHPNIVSVVHGHTSGGFVYRLPSASAPSLFPPNDLELIEHLGERYTETTGRPVRPSSTHPTQHRYGTLISWAYWDQGIVGWVPEYSPGPEAWVTDFDGDGEISPLEEMRFNDEELGGKYFSPWRSFRHPQFGEVEIGGWHSKFWGQNPPAEFLEEECAAQMPWILYLVRQAPRVALDAPEVTPLGDDRVRIRVVVRNDGYLPTSLTGRGTVGAERPDGSVWRTVVRPPWVRIALEGAELEEGDARVQLPHLRGTGPYLTEVGERSASVEWVVRLEDPSASAVVTVRSDKGGTARSGRVELRGEER